MISYWLYRSNVRLMFALLTLLSNLPCQQFRPLDALCSENLIILFAVVLSQYTRVTDGRQTTSYDKSGTLQCNCNVPLKLHTNDTIPRCEPKKTIVQFLPVGAGLSILLSHIIWIITCFLISLLSKSNTYGQDRGQGFCRGWLGPNTIVGVRGISPRKFLDRVRAKSCNLVHFWSEHRDKFILLSKCRLYVGFADMQRP